MKRFISSLLFALMILIGTASFAQSPSPAESNKALPASTASDTVDVQHVIDAYHEAVLTHDGSRQARLFIPQGSMWLNVLSDDAYARAKAKSPDAVKIRVGSSTQISQRWFRLQRPPSIRRTHLQENSDGTIASVYFDLVFLVDGKEQNRGS